MVDLRVCFSWGSGFGEFSAWVNRDSQAESQLKQMPCLVGCKNAELYFLDSGALGGHAPDQNPNSATGWQITGKDRRCDTFVPGENAEEILQANQEFSAFMQPIRGCKLEAIYRGLGVAQGWGQQCSVQTSLSL